MENKKRCPKCGEENPPEAVMCWACYTPLTNTVNVGAGASRAARASGPSLDDDDEESKPSTPPWQIAVIAIGLVFVLFMVAKNFLPSGNTDDAVPVAASSQTQPGTGAGAPAPGPAADTGGGGSNDSSVPAPQKLPFTIAVSPNPSITVGTMAIVSTDPNISAGQAAALASFTKNQFSHMKRWSKLYIYVFKDEPSAQQFANYQRQRSGAPLADSDYRNLSSLWSSALACYEYNNGSERMYNPSNNPSGWWGS